MDGCRPIWIFDGLRKRRESNPQLDHATLFLVDSNVLFYMYNSELNCIKEFKQSVI
jgi:hypothetical protein